MQARRASGLAEEYEGLSTDDELDPESEADFQEKKGENAGSDNSLLKTSSIS